MLGGMLPSSAGLEQLAMANNLKYKQSNTNRKRKDVFMAAILREDVPPVLLN